MESLFKFLESVPIYVWMICGAAFAIISEIIKRAKKSKLKSLEEDELNNNTSQVNESPKQNIQWWEMKIDDFPILERRNIDTGEKLQVALYDFEKLMNWNDAVIKCKSIGDDWRLPTLNELEILYNELHLKNVGNFYGNWNNQPTYWSITELSRPDEKLQLNFIDENGELKSKLIERKEAWIINFSRGEQTYNLKNAINRIRAVRNLLTVC